MKRVLIVCCAILVALAAQAQSFSWTDAAGATFDITITDATNKYAKVTRGDAPTGATEITVPGSVPYNGNTYTVTDVAGRVTSVNGQYYWNVLKKIILSEGIRIIRSYTLHLAFQVEEVVFPSTLELIEPQACSALGLKHIDLSNTKVRFIGWGAFTSLHGTIESIKFPQTLRRLDGYTLDQNSQAPLKNMTLPAQLDTIAYLAFRGLANLEEITFEKPTPALLYMNNPLNPSEGPFDPFRDCSNLQAIHVPVDATKAYMDKPWWTVQGNKYREKLIIGSNGYSTYYLENENFKVPAGCTAYIITDVQPGATAAAPYKAMTQSIAAGSIIPKQTGFILQGTAGSTVEYEANVAGTEVSVSNNLLVGTATEAKVGNDGTNKYYLFGHKGTNQGFYWQTGTGGEYVNLKAHKAALKVAKSQVGYAKSFVIDFEDTTTGIRSVDNTTPQKNDIIYDLQGRRVINPTRGIYIVNGKKRVFN